ncbi:hypothetical protein ACPV4Z_02250 [Vibrio aestuarianus]|uniref:hypothetical protein n=1 Tax=Vibrio aestuarianus TaxID=28171 RepID=UPI0040693F5E
MAEIKLMQLSFYGCFLFCNVGFLIAICFAVVGVLADLMLIEGDFMVKNNILTKLDAY